MRMNTTEQIITLFSTYAYAVGPIFTRIWRSAEN